MQHAFAPARPANQQRGFTLVELMVGLVLGLLTVLLITQVLAAAEGKSRSIESGSSAQVNGSLAMFALQRDIQQAGYGAVTSPDSIGCTVKAKVNAGGTPFSFPLVPVVITDGASGAADTITIRRANTANSSTPIPVTSHHTSSDTEFVVESTLGVSAGDQLIVVPPGGVWETDSANWWCTMFTATPDGSNPLTTTRLPQVAGGWNQAAVMPTGQYIGSALPSQPRSYLLNMGTMVERTYSVSADGNLQVAERSAVDGTVGAPQDLFSQVVNIQALYGKDTDADGVIDTYDNATPTTNAGWLQVLAVRIAVVSRSTQYERDEVTKQVPLWDMGTTATVPGTTTCNTTSKCLSLSVGNASDWKHYRYKVYDTIVPLRNVLWNS